ncbi:glutamate--cysteine ligase [Shewanella gelidimarina]|uniref:glutamate--cysteine ligase n=1 Tax=Shewanella gelidimarina TaxID=56813 RepID=UPI0020101C44|nr:glutamate--cysteine ligase [Shewanella gelidimarina]MCL1058904.1 glutamate--cysteine ligase [Shewanella gelidimarina]
MKSFNELVGDLSDPTSRQALKSMQRGIEREALRIEKTGHLATDSHPEALGSALMHSRITTDYSESLLEFITPVFENIDELVEDLTYTHAYSVRNLNGQQLWPVSMPCYVGDVADIPIADYGSSNNGKMKRLYRKGLTYRYGALMQIISGVHFNFSVSDDLWTRLYELSNKALSKEEFISDSYFGLIRNYRRLVWVLPYLFGASPALCGSFVKDQKTTLPFEKIGKGTLYLPYATSLRMSDLGYTNQEQDSLDISYNNLSSYLDGMNAAINMPSANFAQIGVKVEGEYRQLNANVLQIENEFYSPIRAKRVAKGNEKPSESLARAGVEYIEVRALDVNPYSAVGIEKSQIRFLDMFLLNCLLQPSSNSDETEEAEISANLQAVVLEGRKPGLVLSQNGADISLTQWLETLFINLGSIAELLDDGVEGEYQKALAHWHKAVVNPDETLSGRIMTKLQKEQVDHGHWVKELAQQYHQQLIDLPISDSVLARYEQDAKTSLGKQAASEALDEVSFDQFLADYFEQ